MLVLFLIITILVGIALSLVVWYVPDRYARETASLSSVPIRSLIQNAQTLDLLTVWTPNEFGASVIKLFTQTRWIHVAFIYREGETAYVIEVSGEPNVDFNPGQSSYFHHMMDGIKSIFSKNSKIKNKKKIQPIPLELYVEKQLARKCQVAWIHYTQNAHARVEREIMPAIANCTLTSNPLDFLQAIRKTPFKATKKKLSSLLCTELIVETLQRLGLFHKTFQPSNYDTGELMFDALWNKEHSADVTAFQKPMLISM